jgi:hypothetical protein
VPPPAIRWACAACTFINSNARRTTCCEMCGTVRRMSSAARHTRQVCKPSEFTIYSAANQSRLEEDGAMTSLSHLIYVSH